MRILKDQVYIFIREEEMPTGVEKKDGDGFRLRLPPDLQLIIQWGLNKFSV